MSLIGTISTALKATFILTASVMENQARASDAHKAVLDAIRIRDTAGASYAMNRVLDLAAEDVNRSQNLPKAIA